MCDKTRRCLDLFFGKLAFPLSIVWSALVLAITILALGAWGAFLAAATTAGFVVSVVFVIQLALSSLCHLGCVGLGAIFAHSARKDNPREWPDQYKIFAR